jgi:hypothetical protein
MPALVLLLLTSAPAVRAVTEFVDVELQPETITVGDPVRARLTLVWDGSAPATTPIFPNWEETWGRAEVLARGRVESVSSNAGRRIYTQTLTLTAFETGEIELPPAEVTILLGENEVVVVPTRAGARFMVESVLPEEVEGGAAEIEPRPPSPLRELAANRRFLWTAGSLAALSALAWVFVARRAAGAARAAAAAAAPPPMPEPLQELLAALRRIDVRGGSEPVHTALSLALRRFLARTLSFNAIESTTLEIERTLGARPLPEELAEGTVELLRDCDQVKYAKLEVGTALAGERLSFLSDLAREIDRAFAPPEAGPPA